MVEPVDVDDVLVFVDPVDDSVRPDPCAVPTFELPSEPMPDPERIGGQATEAKFDGGPDDAR